MDQMVSNETLIRFLSATPAQHEAIDRILDRRGPEPPNTLAGPLLLNMSEAAKFLGVSRATLWRMVRAGRLTKIEILPGSFRIRRVDLETFVTANGVAQ